MKILIVSQYFWPEQFIVNDLVDGLTGKNFEVTVLTGMPNYPFGKHYEGYGWFRPRKQKRNSITIYRVPVIPRGNGRALRLILNYCSFALFASILGPFYCRGDYDAIFVYQTSPITAALPAIVMKKLKKAALYLWVQDLWPESITATGMIKSPLILKVVAGLVKFIYRRCDKILVQSRAFIEHIKSFDIPTEKIAYFPNWVQKIYQQDSNPPSHIAQEIPEGFVIMFAGNLGRAQSLETILAAANELRDNPAIRWVIIGDGTRRAWLEQQVQQQQLTNSVTLLGHKNTEFMPSYFKKANVLLASLTKNYIFSLTVPSKIQAYMASGKPIIASLNGEGAKIINEARAGFSCPAQDADALVQTVQHCYQLDQHQLAQLGENARAYYEDHFSRDLVLRKFCNLFSPKEA